MSARAYRPERLGPRSRSPRPVALFASLALLGGIAVALPARADDSDRDEDAMFGDDDASKSSEPSSSDRRDEDALFGDSPAAAPDLAARAEAQNDPLQLGGLLYIRPSWSFVDSSEVEDHTIRMPNLLEVYLDGRPNERLRAYVRGRLTWDPTASDEPTALGAVADPLTVGLDQLWLNFDIARAVYVTVGQTHVRWGASRTWNPVDVLNRSRRDPLAPFDERTGIPVLKLHAPVESLGWNFYVLGMMDDVQSIDRAGIAGRAEFVIATTELGLTSAWRDGIDPRVGLDWSAGVWDVDLTGEVGMTFEEARPTLQVTAGVQYGVRYGDDDTVYVGAEYFFNEAGFDSVEDALFDAAGASNATEFGAAVAEQSGLASIDMNDSEAIATAAARATTTVSRWIADLPWFYLGRHYAAAFVSLPAPGSWNDTSWTVSTLGNLSDRSFISRLDVSFRTLTYLTVQAFVQVHYGAQGELRMGSNVFGGLNDAMQQAASLGLGEAGAFAMPTQVAQVGLWLRLDI